MRLELCACVLAFGCVRSGRPGFPARSLTQSFAWRCHVGTFPTGTVEGVLVPSSTHLQVRGPSGAQLWRRTWDATPDDADVLASIPFEGPGVYELEAGWAMAGTTRASAKTLRFPVRSPGERVEAWVEGHRPLIPGPPTPDVRLEITAPAGEALELDVLQEPTSVGAGVYRVTNRTGDALGSVLLEPVQRTGPFEDERHQRRDARGTSCPRIGRSRLLQPGTARVVDEGDAYCAFDPLPEGGYVQRLEVLDVGVPSPELGEVTRTLELEHPFSVTHQARARVAKPAFPDVPLEELGAPHVFGEAALFSTRDGGWACACVGTPVGREAIPVVDVNPDEVTLRADGGKPIISRTGLFSSSFGDSPVSL